MSLCYKSQNLFPGDICQHDSVLTWESTASGGRGGWTILPSCSASTVPDKISQEVLGDTPGDGNWWLELDNTFLSARQIPVTENQLQHLLQPQPMPPAALSPPTSSSEPQSMWHIYATSVLSNAAFFFFLSLNAQLLFRLFSCLDDSISPLRSNFTLLCFLLNSTVWLLP